MTTQLGKRTTALEALQGSRLDGKLAIVTGANSGIGVETTRALASAGANVAMACRSVDAGQTVANELRAKLPASSGTLEVQALDLADLTSVRTFVAAFLASKRTLDLLINNAGIMAPPLSTSKQGFESQLGTNHLGHFALTTGLLPALSPTARVVTVSSDLHTRGTKENLLATLEGDPQYTQRRYSGFTAYGDSKLANVLFAKALAKRLGPAQISVAVHPGVIATNLSRSLGLLGVVFRVVTPLVSKNVEQGAATSVWGATSAALASQSGAYLVDCAIAQPSATARDEALAEMVWTLSERAVQARA